MTQKKKLTSVEKYRKGIAERAGKACLAKHGPEFYSKIAKKRWNRVKHNKN